MSRHTAACDRARLWASLAVDSEISELERSLLRAHTASCPACRRYARRIAAVADELRRAPRSEPSRPIWRRLEHRKATVRRWHFAASVAAVALSLLVGGVAARLTSSHGDGSDPSGGASWMFYTAYRSAPQTALTARLSRPIPS